MKTLALELRGLKKHFGRIKALDGLDLAIPTGTVFGFVGPNGAGKTTAFSIIAGLLRPDSGLVNILGNGAFNPSIHQGQVSILPQDSQIPGHSRVRECLIYFARLQGLSGKEAARSADEVLDWVELKDRGKSPVRTLSHGMFRRLTVAQAFLGAPRLVLLDEPTSGLDPKQVVNIRSLIQSRRNSQTVIVSSHILSEIETACDHVAFIDHGQTIRQDSMEAIIRKSHQISYTIQPGSDPRDALMAAVPGAEITLTDDGTRLTILLRDVTINPSEINARVLPILLEHGIGIVEISRGSDLESEYLNQ